MKTYLVTIGKINVGIMGNEFAENAAPRAIRASSPRAAAAAGMGTRARLTTEHDIEAVYAVDADFGPDGSIRSDIRAAKVEDVA